MAPFVTELGSVDVEIVARNGRRHLLGFPHADDREVLEPDRIERVDEVELHGRAVHSRRAVVRRKFPRSLPARDFLSAAEKRGLLWTAGIGDVFEDDPEEGLGHGLLLSKGRTDMEESDRGILRMPKRMSNSLCIAHVPPVRRIPRFLR